MDDLFGIEKKTEQNEEVKESKPLTIFDYLNDIRVNKKGNIQEKDPNLSKFDTFMILRFLSLDEGYLPYINIINEFQSILTKEEAYKLLLITIPRSKKFLKFPKKTEKDIDEDVLNLLSNYFKCSKHEIEDFFKLQLIGSKDIENIRLLYGGKK